jgi:hypothetical protein
MRQPTDEDLPLRMRALVVSNESGPVGVILFPVNEHYHPNLLHHVRDLAEYYCQEVTDLPIVVGLTGDTICQAIRDLNPADEDNPYHEAAHQEEADEPADHRQ